MHIGRNQNVAADRLERLRQELNATKSICRFYLPDSGKLTLFGADSKDWDADAFAAEHDRHTGRAFV